MTRRAVFLDRDGVLAREIVRDNRAYAPTALEDFALVDGVGEQVRRLQEAGLARLVFTNQPEVARGLLSWDTLDAMHQRLRDAAPIDEVYVCPHDQDDGCACRKPSPGMLTTAAERWDIDLSRSFVIGDRWRDIEAGRAVGCCTILLERPYSECMTADHRVATFAEAVDAVLEHLDRGEA
ncbi:MAG: HAD family hydrolase [Chloroflexi bacterium]|nr:HAD family hydrolase [Chloroflexota bacterium]